MKNLIACICLFLFCFSGSTPYYYGAAETDSGATACTGTAGTDVGSTEYNVANVNYAYLMEVTVSSGCQADTGDEICAVIKNYDQSTYEFTFMVYDSDGGSGEPGTLLDSMAVSSSNSGSLDTVCENLTQSITFRQLDSLGRVDRRKHQQQLRGGGNRWDKAPTYGFNKSNSTLYMEYGR
jgi:hypothetical protein